jgi:hypothetical protein
MKPITISAMVAGVHAGRISAVVFMFFAFLQLEPAGPAACNRNGKRKKAIQDKIGTKRSIGWHRQIAVCPSRCTKDHLTY